MYIHSDAKSYDQNKDLAHHFHSLPTHPIYGTLDRLSSTVILANITPYHVVRAAVNVNNPFISIHVFINDNKPVSCKFYHSTIQSEIIVSHQIVDQLPKKGLRGAESAADIAA